MVDVWVREHGHWVRRKTIIPAHTVYSHTKHIPFGARTAIGGRLRVKRGSGLRDQTVKVLSAPDNRSNHYRRAATVKTAVSGRWHATLPAGPSRLIKAVYGGSSTDEPATSPRAKVIVPAKVEVLRLRPRRVKWGGTVHIDGCLAGGDLPPPPAGELVRLRLGYGRAYTTYGVKTDVTGNGRFKVTFTFGSGPGQRGSRLLVRGVRAARRRLSVRARLQPQDHGTRGRLAVGPGQRTLLPRRAEGNELTSEQAVIGDIFQPTHLLFLLVVVLLVLGPKRLPEMARSLGRVFGISRKRSTAKNTRR